MLKPFALTELSHRYGGDCIHGEHLFDRVSTDSRSLQSGQLFVALKGERFDAHDYLADVIDKGAGGLVIQKNKEAYLAGNSNLPVWLVNDTTKALGDIANYQRRHFQKPLVAITGSSGKTTVKGMLREIFSIYVGDEGVFATPGNFNNHIGVPLSLLQIQPTHQYAIIEMGASGPNEISYLSQMARPDVAIINNVMAAHVEGFGSIEGIAKAKSEIYQGLGEQGTAIINTDDHYAKQWLLLNRNRKTISYSCEVRDSSTIGRYCDVYVQNFQKQKNGCYQFSLACGQQSTCVSLSVLGQHNIRNAAAAASCALALGMDIEFIRKGLEQFSGEAGRLQVSEGLNGCTVIDDTYNANPGSMRAAIDVLAEMDGQQIFVMGDMGELGDNELEEHRDIGVYAASQKIDTLLTIGEKSIEAQKSFNLASAKSDSQHFSALDQLNKHLYWCLHKNADMHCAVLVKGSRSARMERVVDSLHNSQSYNRGDNNNASLVS